jgi:hypothetical protein
MNLTKKKEPILTGEALPKFDAVFDYPQRIAALSSASQALAAAGARYQALYANAWWSSWFDHARDDGLGAITNVYGFVDEGLSQANKAVLELQNSDRFLACQRELVSSITRFRHRHRDVAEMWQLWSHAPTRRDVDEMAESLYELRREVRRLRRQVNKEGPVAPAAKPLRQPEPEVIDEAC